MKSYRSFIKEAKDKVAVFAFGRMNPPTEGHSKLIKMVMVVAKKEKGIPMVFPSKTEDKKKNPLSFKTKVKVLKDVFGNIINTDTGIASASFQHFDFSPLYTTWTDNTISELHIIYKDHQKEFVEFFSSSVDSDYSGTIGINLHIEEGNTIYPYTITDAAEKFILRLAYDEAAILDSTYAKNNLNLLDLFYDNNATASIATYYHSGSGGVVACCFSR